jgi:hypothetical protein
VHPQVYVATADHGAVQRRLCGTGFVSCHFDKAEAPAFAGEDIRGYADRAHRAELTEHCADGFFGDVLRQLGGKQLFHLPAVIRENTNAYKVLWCSAGCAWIAKPGFVLRYLRY